MEQKPREIIFNAKECARKDLLEKCSGEITRICNEFSDKTGYAISNVRFDFMEVTTFGDSSPKTAVCGTQIDYVGV